MAAAPTDKAQKQESQPATKSDLRKECSICDGTTDIGTYPLNGQIYYTPCPHCCPEDAQTALLGLSRHLRQLTNEQEAQDAELARLQTVEKAMQIGISWGQYKWATHPKTLKKEGDTLARAITYNEARAAKKDKQTQAAEQEQNEELQ